jgi:tetratricopeptide (TPR) repeat protein
MRHRRGRWRQELAASHDRLGDVLTAQGNLPGALAAYRGSFEILERLAAADPRNVGWQHNLGIGHVKLGDVLTAQGNLPGALGAYEVSLGILERLAAADPGNAGWQRTLARGARHPGNGRIPRAA